MSQNHSILRLSMNNICWSRMTPGFSENVQTGGYSHIHLQNYTMMLPPSSLCPRRRQWTASVNTVLSHRHPWSLSGLGGSSGDTQTPNYSSHWTPYSLNIGPTIQQMMPSPPFPWPSCIQSNENNCTVCRLQLSIPHHDSVASDRTAETVGPEHSPLQP